MVKVTSTTQCRIREFKAAFYKRPNSHIDKITDSPSPFKLVLE